jgi:hypothetical protein
MGKMSYFHLPASEHHNDADEKHDQDYAQQDDFHKGHDMTDKVRLLSLDL